MAERKFDYNAVKDVYGGMKSINEQIKTLLTESDSEVKDKVSVVDEALYGDLGAQMLLNWENISSNFPSFMDNFDNWAALVSKASGNYQQFESDVAGFKEANPYGATSGGIKASFVSSSSYNNSLTAEEIEALDSKLFIYEEVDPVYIDTGMVHQAKVTKALNIFTDVMNVVGLVSTTGAVVKIARNIFAVSTPAVLVSQTDDIAGGVTRVIAQNGDDAVRGVSNVAVTQGDDIAGGVTRVVAQNGDDAVRGISNVAVSQGDDAARGVNTAVRDRIDDMVGITRPAANTQGAPTAANSAFNQPNTALQNQIDDMVGITRPAANTQGAPTAANSAFNQPNTALQNQIDDMVGITRPAANTQGAPTAGNSALASSTDDILISGKKDMGTMMSDLDDIYKPGAKNPDQLKAQYIFDRVDDGSITSKDQVLQLFDGSESAAKRVMNTLPKTGESNSYNTLMKMIKNGGTTSSAGNNVVVSSVDEVTGTVDDILLNNKWTKTADGNSVFNQPNTALQNQIDDMVGITRPAANTQGAPTAANSAFNQPNTALQNQIDDMVGITRPAANTQGAPTINNSALANATDDQLRMAQAGVGVDSPVQQRIDALTGVSKPAASTQGAPTVSDSAFYADNLGGKLNRFSNQVQAGTQNMKNTISGGLNTAKQGFTNGAQAARKGYEFSKNFAQEAGVANMKTVVPISSSGVGASATEVIRNEFINNDPDVEG